MLALPTCKNLLQVFNINITGFFYSLLNDNQYYYKTVNSRSSVQIQIYIYTHYNGDTGTQNIIEIEILPPSVLQNVN